MPQSGDEVILQGRLYLHIGPPKTATTAFQYALQDGIPSQLIYGGVRQPRASENSEISWRLHRLCGRFRGNAIAEIQEVQKTIASTLASGSNLLISEEGFLVDSRSVPFQEKIKRLGRVVGTFCPDIILCARDPLEGLPSLYQELYLNLPLRQKLSFKRFIKSNQAKVFDYPALLEVLKRAGFKNIRVIAFDQLINGEINFSDIFGRKFDMEGKLTIPKVNVGCCNGAKNQRTFNPLEFRDILPKFLLKIFQRNNNILGKYSKKISGLNLTKARVRRLEFPEAMANRLRMGHLAVVREKTK